MSIKLLLSRYLLLAFLWQFASSGIADELLVDVSDEAITVERFQADGDYLIVWTAGEGGFKKNHRNFAKLLAEAGIEVWQADILTSLFILRSPMALKELDGKYLADLIEYAHELTGKKIVLMGHSYSAVTVLHGAHHWQSRQNEAAYLLGAVLFSPYTYSAIPTLGSKPDYMPIVSATSIPVMIYQAANSSAMGQIDDLMERLQQHDNPVYVRYLPEIVSMFYKHPPTEQMQQIAKSLPADIKGMIGILSRYETPLNAVPLPEAGKLKSGIDVEMQAYTGKTQPKPIELYDVSGEKVVINNYQGKVRLINFWASWCPPCVEEIPSMNRLKEKMAGKNFEMISINFAEDEKTVRKFLQEVDVDFPVLLDLKGNISAQWNVISFPSTFVIDKQGKIIYGVNAAIEWDDPGYIKKLKALL